MLLESIGTTRDYVTNSISLDNCSETTQCIIGQNVLFSSQNLNISGENLTPYSDPANFTPAKVCFYCVVYAHELHEILSTT